MYKCGELNKLVKALNNNGIVWEDCSSYETIKTGYGKCDWSFERVRFDYKGETHKCVCALWQYQEGEKKLIEYWHWTKKFDDVEPTPNLTTNKILERLGINGN